MDTEIIREYLKETPYLLECASDGEAAWYLLDAEPERFDAIILDRVMPQLSGIEDCCAGFDWRRYLDFDPERMFHAGIAPADTAEKRQNKAVNPEPPLVDWTALRQRFESSPGFVPRLLQTAINSQRDTPGRIRATAASGELDAFFRLTHAIKGFAGNLCAEPLREQADRLCEQARGGDHGALDSADALASALECLLKELARQVETSTADRRDAVGQQRAREGDKAPRHSDETSPPG
ncbi:Hpt domain protein [Thiorhodovibrio winogradskyi]|uniref:Hpt domain protein n=1 Tax=Thiorhodovibrio winogradskyi TaxID=77007 RepID=A0ABZ0S750_9GAMM